MLLESQRRNGKVNNGDFDTGFRGVMRIGQRGGQKQLKIFIITDLLFAQLDDIGAPLFLDILLQYRFKRRLNFIANAFEQDPLSEGNALLNASQKVGFRDFQDFKPLGSVLAHILDKLVGLVLGIYYERPSLCLLDYDPILCGGIVLGQFLQVPELDHNRNSQHRPHAYSARMH